MKTIIILINYTIVYQQKRKFTEALLQHIHEYTTETMTGTVDQLSILVHNDALRESIAIAKELQESIKNIDTVKGLDEKVIEKAIIIQKLHDALAVIKIYTCDTTEDINSKLGPELARLAEVTSHLNDDLEAIVTQAHLKLPEETSGEVQPTSDVPLTEITTIEKLNESDNNDDKSIICKDVKDECVTIAEDTVPLTAEVAKTEVPTGIATKDNSDISQVDQKVASVEELQPVKIGPTDLEQEKIFTETKIGEEITEVVEIAPTQEKKGSMDEVISLELLTSTVGEATEKLAAILTESMKDEEVLKLKDKKEDTAVEIIDIDTESNSVKIEQPIEVNKSVENAIEKLETKPDAVLQESCEAKEVKMIFGKLFSKILLTR